MKPNELVKTSISALGPRLSLVGLLPTMLLVLFLLALVSGGAPTKAPNFDAVLIKIAQLNTAQGLFLVIAILTLTLVLQPFQLILVRLLEGYWGTSKLAKALNEVFVNRHHEKRDRLQAKLDTLLQFAQHEIAIGRSAPQAAEAGQLSDRIERFYPKSRQLPTTLGNVLRAGEENAGAPYSLDVITVWPRLYAILPERTAALVNDQRNQLDITVRFCVTFGMATVVSLGLLFQHGWWLMVPLATLALAWMSYRGAVASALAYGVGIRTAVDLHRFALLRALHLPLPPDREAEKQTNELLSGFLRQGQAVNFHYDHSPDK